MADLKLSKEMHVKRLMASRDSHLVVSFTRDKGMAFYLKKVMESFPSFEKFESTQIPKVGNVHADALLKLASSKDSELLKIVSIEHISRSSISK